MRLILSFAALYLSVVLLQLSNGGLGPLDVLSGFELAFTTEQIGLLGSAHFIGFFIGCWSAPRLMGTVGHSRAFAAFTATGAIGILAHMLFIDPYLWAIFRVASGLCVAGCYTVVEAWLQAKVKNENRGRMMSIYRAVDIGGSFASQLLIGVLSPANYVSYNILALLCCATLIPIALTKISQPQTPGAPRLRPMLAIKRSPLAAAGVVVAALSGASFRMVGPLYGTEVGLSFDQIAIFLAIFVLGGALSQYPVGWLADRYDRRWVLIWLSVAAIFSCLLTAFLPSTNATVVMCNAAFFGLTTFPIFSVAAAHAHDFANADERVELSAALMFFFALGAIAAPYTASALIEAYGPSALFLLIGTGHITLVIYGLYRMGVRPTVEDKTPYIYAPRTSFTIGRLLKRPKDEK
tara:strand:+ start:2864 stop:4087 length:1224 start_codon:yes stop_codon:yes gene_type:complete